MKSFYETTHEGTVRKSDERFTADKLADLPTTSEEHASYVFPPQEQPCSSCTNSTRLAITADEWIYYTRRVQRYKSSSSPKKTFVPLSSIQEEHPPYFLEQKVHDRSKFHLKKAEDRRNKKEKRKLKMRLSSRSQDKFSKCEPHARAARGRRRRPIRRTPEIASIDWSDQFSEHPSDESSHQTFYREVEERYGREPTTPSEYSLPTASVSHNYGWDATATTAPSFTSTGDSTVHPPSNDEDVGTNHGPSVPSSNVDGISQPPVDVNERNRLFRTASATPPQVPTHIPSDSSELDELLSTVSDITTPEGMAPETAELVSFLENIVVLGWQVGRAQSFTDIFVAVVAYIKMHTHESVIQTVLEVIDVVTKAPKEEEIAPHAWSGRDVLEKWSLFRTNTIFTKISYLMTAAMSLTICKVKEIEWSPLGLKLVALEASKVQLKAVDVIDALLGTFTWVAETGYRVFEERSLVPLLYSNQKMQKFNADCDYVLAHADQVLAGNHGDVQSFEFKVDAVTRTLLELKKAQDSGPTALWLQDKYSKLIEIKYKIVAKHRNTAIRFAPLGLAITGPTCVGKSTLAKITMKTALNAMEFPCDSRRIITKDMFDKYDSTYTSDILGVYMDDIGNGKAQFAQASPTDVIIKFFNNMAAQAVKAEITGKGVVFIGFKVGIATSNSEDLECRPYTNCPESILRRFTFVRARIKPKYRVPGGVSLNTDHPDLSGKDASLLTDVWELDIEECYVYEKRTGVTDYKMVIKLVKMPCGKTIVCKNLGLGEYLDVLVVLAKQHKSKQRDVVNRSEEFDSMTMCDTCSRPSPICKCVQPHSLESLSDIVVDTMTKSAKNYVKSWIAPVNLLNSIVGYRPVKWMTTRSLAREVTAAMHETATPFLISITPDWMFRTTVFQRSINVWQSSAALYDMRWYLRITSFLGLSGLAYSAKTRNKDYFLGSVAFAWLSTSWFWASHRARIKCYKQEYLNRRDALPVYAQKMRDGYAAKGAITAATLVIALKLYRMWNKQRLKDSDLTPASITPEEVESTPGWFGFMMKNLGVECETTTSSKRATPSHIVSTLEKNNLLFAEFQREDGSRTQCAIFFPRKSVAWFPEHVFYTDANMTGTPTPELTVTVYRHKNKSGGKFVFKTELAMCSSLPELDLVCAYVPNCPDFKNKMKWLPVTAPKASSTSMCTFVYRDKEGTQSERVNVDHGQVGHKYRQFFGGSYTSQLAKVGACMSPLVLEQKEPAIIGFHIGGVPDKAYGVMQTVTLAQGEQLVSELEAMDGVCLSANATDLPETQYGIKIIEKPEPHAMCMAARLKEDDFVDVLGSTRLRTTQKSRVTKSMLSDAVSEVMGIPNTWGPPQLAPNWKAYNATLEHIVNPAGMFRPSHLERARQDWLGPLKAAMLIYIQNEDFRPLTDKEAIMGIPNKRFLDPLKMKTGMGFPVFGPKHRHFEEVRELNIILDQIPDESVVEEIERLLTCWENNERGYPVFSGTLKDEPTPLGSEKVRVFQAVAVAMGFHVRKYFLPLARFLSKHPLLSESAVGINSFSPQWDKLMSHAEKYADGGLSAGWDYSKYDVRMNSQMTRAVLTSFIDLAEIGGYPASDIKIMKAMVVDLVHPLLDYNGAMLMSYNTHTSGNNITVNVNGAAGSLYVRLGFFNSYPDAEDFRSCVAAMTYGDDFTGSVHPDYRDFNFVSYRDYLHKHGMKITLPDKSEGGGEFLNAGEGDFLKRASNYIPEIGTRIGMIDEKSLFKSLHSNVKSAVALETEVATSCIETAMHEWFAHGRTVYESRARQMQEVCRRVKLPVPAVNFSYDERVANWKEKYV